RPGGPGKVVYTPLFPGNPDPPSEVSIRDRAGKEHFCFKGHTGGIVSALFTRDGRHISSLDGAGSHKVWEALTGKVLLSQKSPIDLERPVPTFPGSVLDDYCVEVSADGRRLTETLAQSVKVWDVREHKEVFAFHGQTNNV